MSRFIVTHDMKSFLKAEYPKLDIEALTVAFNHRFHTEKTPQQVKAMVKCRWTLKIETFLSYSA